MGEGVGREGEKKDLWGEKHKGDTNFLIVCGQQHQYQKKEANFYTLYFIIYY